MQGNISLISNNCDTVVFKKRVEFRTSLTFLRKFKQPWHLSSSEVKSPSSKRNKKVIHAIKVRVLMFQKSIVLIIRNLVIFLKIVGQRRKETSRENSMHLQLQREKKRIQGRNQKVLLAVKKGERTIN